MVELSLAIYELLKTLLDLILSNDPTGVDVVCKVLTDAQQHFDDMGT